VTILLTGQSLFFTHFAPSVNFVSVPCSRQPAWGGARPSPSFSPSPNNARLPNGPPPATTQAVSFPPLGPSTPTPRQDHKVVLQNLAALTVRVIYHQPITVGSLCSLLIGDGSHSRYQDRETL
jgi:hypothetical protein